MIEKDFGFAFCRFDEESYKVFIEEFFPQQMVSGLKSCPECSSEDIHYYKDYFVCFNCKFKAPMQFILTEDNNYLARYNKTKDKIEFFHRFLMDKEIKEFAELTHLKLNQIHVHHENECTTDNWKGNLTVMSEDEHKEHHQEVGQERAYDTFRSKKYGEYSDRDCWEEFEEWQEKKSREW